jgi:hypothetical protein
MTPNPCGGSDEPSEDAIRSTRTETISGAYTLMQEFKEVSENTVLCYDTVARTVEDYLRERKALKDRDKIPSRIQRHKVAGLMTLCIVRFRPLQDFFPDGGGLTSMSDSQFNEKFAVFHGVAICAEDCNEERIKALLNNPHFRPWVDNFVELLRSGCPCPMTIIQIYGTLCLGFFPENLGHTE